MIQKLTNRMIAASYALCGIPLNEENMSAKVMRLARTVFTSGFASTCQVFRRFCGRRHRSQKEIANPLPEVIVNARKLLKHHRFDSEVADPQRIINGIRNTQFNDCDAVYTQLFHQAAMRMYSETNLNKNLEMIQSEAADIIKNELCNHGDATACLRRYCHSVWEKLTVLDFQGLSAEQAKNITNDFKRSASNLVAPVINHALFEYGVNPELQTTAYQSLERNAFNPEAFDTEIMKMVVEVIRKYPPVAETDRGENRILIELLAKDRDVVGPDPFTFNPNRIERLPDSWPLLPWPAFGGGKHVCPGWRLAKYLTVQFLTVLLRDYRIVRLMGGSLRFLPRTSP